MTQRYRRMCKQIGVRTTIHKLRHYSATELILAGVDIRTVAGRLGHAGGGATTLRTYAAWVSEGDQRAAREIAARMPSRAGPRPLIVDIDPRTAYQRIAVSLRDQILDRTFLPGLPIPTIKQLAATYDVSVPTAKRAVDLLSDWRFVQVTPGQRTLVRGLPIDAPDQRPVPIEDSGGRGSARPDRDPLGTDSISKCVTLAEWSTGSAVLPTPTMRQHCTACSSTRSDERAQSQRHRRLRASRPTRWSARDRNHFRGHRALTGRGGPLSDSS